MDLSDWNKKIYRNEDGSFVGGGLHAEELWEEFGIKSGPKFERACWSHIPERWAEDVRVFIREVQAELGDRVVFEQIKEKFCDLTVYCRCVDDYARKRLLELKQECVERLINKGVHPQTNRSK